MNSRLTNTEIAKNAESALKLIKGIHALSLEGDDGGWDNDSMIHCITQLASIAMEDLELIVRDLNERSEDND